MSLLALGGLATLATAEIIAAACNAWIPIAVGTYTSSGSEGIYLCRFNQESGEAELKATAATDNPSFLAASPDGRIIYAVDESGLDTDGVKAFALTGESALSCMRSVPAAGKAPCYMLAGEHFVATANYTDGSISVFSLDNQGFLEKRIQKLDFALTGPAPDTVRQQSAHLHCLQMSPDKRYMYACDLGNDCIYVFDVAEGETPLRQIGRVDVAAGSGPRHIVISADGRFAYVVTELSGEVLVFACEGSKLVPLQAIECDKAHARASSAIRLSPDGRFLYAGNRKKNDGIAIFAVDEKSGLLAESGYCPTRLHPRDFAISPNGKFLLCACRDSNVVQVFSVDRQTGMLSDTCQDIAIPMPSCILFLDGNVEE